MIRLPFRAGTGVAQGSQMLAANGLLLLLNIATGVLLARSLGPSGRGEVTALTVWPQTLAYLFTLGVPSALVYHTRIDPEKQSELFRAGAVLALIQGSAVTLVGALLIVPLTLAHFGSGVVHLAQLLMLASPVALLGLVTAGALQARTRFGAVITIQLSQPVLSLLAFTALALTHRLTARSASLAIILCMLPSLAIFLMTLVTDWGPPTRRMSRDFRTLLSYGLRSYPLDLLGTLGLFVDQALVTALLGPLALGLYIVALRGSRVLNVFQQAAVPVLFARNSGARTDVVVASTGRAARIVLAASLCCAIFVVVFGKPLVELVYGSAFVAAVAALRLLAVEAVLSATAWVLAQAFLALGRPGTVSVLQGVAFVWMVALLFILVPRFGVMGAATALLVGGVIRLGLLAMAFPLVLKCRPPWPIVTVQDVRWVVGQLKAKRQVARAIA